MPNRYRFKVETSVEKAVIIGDPSVFVSNFLGEFARYGVTTEVFPSSRLKAASEFLSQGDVDYCLIFGDSFPHVSPETRTFVFLPLSSRGVVRHLPSHSHVCYYAEFLGGPLEGSPLLEKFLTEAARHKKLTIPGDGLQEVPFLHLEDLLAGFTKFVFSTRPPRELILLHPEGLSLLSLGYKLRSLLPYKIDIVFDEHSNWQVPAVDWEEVGKGQGRIGWRPEKHFDQALPNFIDNFFAQPFSVNTPSTPQTPSLPPQSGVGVSPSRPRLTPLKTKPVPAPVFVPLRKPTRLRLRAHKLSKLKLALPKPSLPAPARIAVSSLVLAFSLYLFSLLASATITLLTLRSLASGEGSFISARAASTALPPAVYLQANLTALSSLPGVKNLTSLREANSLMTSYILGLKTLGSVAKLSETSRAIASYVLSDADADLASSISSARLETDALYSDLSLLDGSLPLSPPGLIPARFHPGYAQIKAKLQEGRRAALTAKSLLTVAPDILGLGSRRKYAVLFQNNMELRATGGFIGSFGLLSLENGKLFDLQIYDVYAADGALKGHVEPPTEIREYLGEVNWYLRDSNWDPDFPTSARRAEWFLGKTIAAEVQGTIAINVNTLQDVLAALGPLSLPDYGETVTADNIFERAEYHAEVGFFPGSTQKKEFIGSVADGLLHQLEKVESTQALKLARALIKSIDEKNTLLALSDPTTNDVLSTLGWNGELRDIPCPDLGGACTADYAMLVDSNFGINKANYFLRREISLDTTIHATRTVAHLLKVNYTNTSTSGAWPAGPYKSYSRLYLPAGSYVSSVKVGNKTLPPSEIKISTEHGRLVAGFLVEVPINSSLTVEVAYELGDKISENSPTYSWYWQKQSGTAADSLTINLNYPLYLEPGIVSPQAVLNNQQLQFNLSNVTDRRITVKFN